MLDATNLALFLATSFVLIVAPGPDIVFLLVQGTNHGAKAGIATALGLAAGNLVHTGAAAIGLSAIISTSAYAFTALKIAGAAYLLYLAYKTIQTTFEKSGSEKSGHEQPAESVSPNQPALWSLFNKGFVMNVLNPKVAIFFLAFLPQFVTSQITPVWQQLLLLGMLFTVLVAIVFSIFGYLAGYLGTKFLKGSTASEKYLKWPIAAIFAGLALKLALTER
jgi:threonine/homoserine/homoserine lactone efflux protein